MRYRSSTTSEKCLPPAEKTCKVTKMNVTKSQNASYTDRIAASNTLVAFCRESVKAKPPSSRWDSRKASAPHRWRH